MRWRLNCEILFPKYSPLFREPAFFIQSLPCIMNRVLTLLLLPHHTCSYSLKITSLPPAISHPLPCPHQCPFTITPLPPPYSSSWIYSLDLPPLNYHLLESPNELLDPYLTNQQHISQPFAITTPNKRLIPGIVAFLVTTATAAPPPHLAAEGILTCSTGRTKSVSLREISYDDDEFSGFSINGLAPDSTSPRCMAHVTSLNSSSGAM